MPPRTCNIFGYEQAEGEGHDDEDQWVLDVEELQEKFKHFNRCIYGYKGLSIYAFIMAFYVFLLSIQSHEPAIGEANGALSDLFAKSKADLVVTNSATMWKFMSTKIATDFLGPLWHGVTEDGRNITGRTSVEFYYLMGGLCLTAVKSQSQNCGTGSINLFGAARKSCYSTTYKTDPFIEMKFPGSANSLPSEVQVPYNEITDGYTVGVPGSAEPNAATELLSAYAGLFGPDTRKARVDGILFNPNGMQTISVVTFAGHLSVRGSVTFYSTVNTIPIQLYDTTQFSLRVQVAMQIILLLLILVCWVGPLLHVHFLEPEDEDPSHAVDRKEADEMRYRNAFRRLQWFSYWAHMPVDGAGDLRLFFVTLLLVVVAVAVGLWLALCVAYWELYDISAKQWEKGFVDPLQGHKAATIADKVRIALENLNDESLPIMQKQWQISGLFQYYFMVQSMAVVLMMFRLFEHLSFQKRLSMVTDTFYGIANDLYHIGCILLLVCFTLGAICSFSFGAHDPHFQSLGLSFWEMIEIPFGMFKPAATVQFNPPLFKYVPHVLLDDAGVNFWPYLLLLLFKVIVMLLLFKLLMGVIMEGYKKTIQFKKVSLSVHEELLQIWTVGRYYAWNHCVKGAPFISFQHVIIALSYRGQAKEDKPWKARYVGFEGGRHHIQKALNKVMIDAKNRPRVRAVVDFHKFGQVGEEETKFCMRFYGRPREVARTALKEDILKDARHKKLAELSSDKQAKEEEAERYAQAVWTDLHDKLEALNERQVQRPDKQLVDAKFKDHDMYCIDQLDIRFVGLLLEDLGYSIRKKDLKKLLKTYDQDGSGTFERAEFDQLLKDKRLIGRRRPIPEELLISNKRTKKKLQTVHKLLHLKSFVKPLKQNLGERSSSKGLAEPLLPKEDALQQAVVDKAEEKDNAEQPSSTKGDQSLYNSSPGLPHVDHSEKTASGSANTTNPMSQNATHPSAHSKVSPFILKAMRQVGPAVQTDSPPQKRPERDVENPQIQEMRTSVQGGTAGQVHFEELKRKEDKAALKIQSIQRGKTARREVGAKRPATEVQTQVPEGVEKAVEAVKLEFTQKLTEQASQLSQEKENAQAMQSQNVALEAQLSELQAQCSGSEQQAMAAQHEVAQMREKLATLEADLAKARSEAVAAAATATTAAASERLAAFAVSLATVSTPRSSKARTATPTSTPMTPIDPAAAPAPTEQSSPTPVDPAAAPAEQSFCSTTRGSPAGNVHLEEGDGYTLESPEIQEMPTSQGGTAGNFHLEDEKGQTQVPVVSPVRKELQIQRMPTGAMGGQDNSEVALGMSPGGAQTPVPRGGRWAPNLL